MSLLVQSALAAYRAERMQRVSPGPHAVTMAGWIFAGNALWSVAWWRLFYA
jgi:hypothetical protein